ncbi:MAG: iron-containing alcohol dehydrogenase, partial [Candidatus Omnitrophica bacterium]|nr:iron-containing alcohol dehydrogenase [Candidatus Omnitrophota bacterium]
MTELFLALILLGASGLAALLAGRDSRKAGWLGAGGVILAGVLGVVPALRAALGGRVESFHAAWPVPYGAFSVSLDPLSAFFILPILCLRSSFMLPRLALVDPHLSDEMPPHLTASTGLDALTQLIE